MCVCVGGGGGAGVTTTESHRHLTLRCTEVGYIIVMRRQSAPCKNYGLSFSRLEVYVYLAVQ